MLNIVFNLETSEFSNIPGMQDVLFFTSLSDRFLYDIKN